MSNNFRIIIDNILNVYFVKQTSLKEIYLYNEDIRKEKIQEVEEYIHTLEKGNNKTLSRVDINRIFTYAVDLFDYKIIVKKKDVTLDFKLTVLEKLGFVFEEIKKGYSFICETI